MKNALRLIMIIGSIGLVATVFQNCSDVKFSPSSDSSLSKTGTGLEVDDPQLPPTDPNVPAEDDTQNTTEFACGVDNVKDIRVNIASAQLGQQTVTVAGGDNSLIQLSMGVDLKTGPAVRANQLRLVLSPMNNQIIDTNDKTYAIKTPSGQQSGLKINFSGPYAFKANTNYKVKFELDTNTQLVKAGDKCILKPVFSVTSIQQQ